MAKIGSGTAVILAVVLASLAVSSREGRGGSATGPEDEAGGTGADGDVCDGTTAYRSSAGSFTVPTQDRVLGAARACALGRAGGEGMPVRALQHALATCYGQPVAVDGEYGGATGDAVAAAQRLH
jgi:Putative peptidoglycan binding domain